MNGYVINLGDESLKNENFRKVVYTAHYSQLVLMSLKPKEEIGEEVHGLDQFIRIEKGMGMAVLDGVQHIIKDEFGVVIPAGMRHNIINTSETDEMKLYTIYSVPEHRDQIVHETKTNAMTDSTDHFDGHTTE